jgi:hypothetical protein
MTGPDGLETEADPAKAITWSRVTRITYKDCAVTLDAPATHNIYEYTKGADVKFVRCKVTYRGGPVFFVFQPELEKYKSRSILFVDCVFDMSVPGPPEDDGQRFIVQLLSSRNLDSVKFKRIQG